MSPERSVKDLFGPYTIRLVGTTGFEPATSPTPRVRDTRLRYVPTGSVTHSAAVTCSKLAQRRQMVQSRPSRLSSAFEQRQESPQSIAQIQQHFPAQKIRGC